MRTDDRSRADAPRVRAGRFVPTSMHHSSIPLASMLLAAALAITGCVPLPTAPTNAARGTRLSQPTTTATLPLPELDAFEIPETPALDDDTVRIRPAGYDAEYRPNHLAVRENTPAGITQSTTDAGLGARHEPRPLSLGDRIRLDRIGSADREDDPPSISITPRGGDRRTPTSRDDDSLTARRDDLLADLSAHAGRDERDLGDGERLAKHRIQMQLIALHFLNPDDPVLLEPLIDSLAHPHEASRRHALLRASFYESIDLERESLAILAELGSHHGVDLARGSAPSFRIAEPIPCTRISGLGEYRTVERSTFRPGTQLRLYVEIFGIANSEVGEKFRQRLRIEFSLVDRDGRARGSQTSRTEGAPTDTPVIDSFLNLRYSLPREVPFGEATLHLTVTDLVSGEVSRQALPLQIEP